MIGELWCKDKPPLSWQLTFQMLLFNGPAWSGGHSCPGHVMALLQDALCGSALEDYPEIPTSPEHSGTTWIALLAVCFPVQFKVVTCEAFLA